MQNQYIFLTTQLPHWLTLWPRWFERLARYVPAAARRNYVAWSHDPQTAWDWLSPCQQTWSWWVLRLWWKGGRRKTLICAALKPVIIKRKRSQVIKPNCKEEIRNITRSMFDASPKAILKVYCLPNDPNRKLYKYHIFLTKVFKFNIEWITFLTK